MILASIESLIGSIAFAAFTLLAGYIIRGFLSPSDLKRLITGK